MSNSLWSSTEAARASGGTVTGNGWMASGISIDSRTLKPGDLFIAIKGDTHDGHDHVTAALKAGAAAVMIERPMGDVPGLVVGNALKGLEQLAKAARKRIREEAFAITGSAGKTTTKEMLRLALGAEGKVHATEGNLNNHIGLPLTLARTPKESQFGVFELGMNHANEIAPLARLLHPDVAIITNVGAAHVQNFKSGVEGVARAKGEILAGLNEDGIAILPRDSEFFPLLADLAKEQGIEEVFSFGTHASADARLIRSGDRIEAEIMGNRLSYTLPVPGEHMALDSVAVLLALAAVGLDVAAAIKALAGFAPLKGRGQQKTVGGVTVIDECYNANPLSMLAAIRLLGGTEAKSRRIAVLGDMLELGDCAPAEHAGLAKTLAEAKVDTVFCCGSLMKNLWDALPESMRGAWMPDAASLAPVVASAMKPGDTVLVKGSRGQQVNIKGTLSPSMAQIIAAIEDKTEKTAHVA